MSTPHQTTIPGTLPQGADLAEAKNRLEAAESSAKKAKTRMQQDALILAERVAQHLAERPSTPSDVTDLCAGFLNDRAEYLAWTQDAGAAAAEIASILRSVQP